MSTYRIEQYCSPERQRELNVIGEWTTDGIGEAEGWATIEEAMAAIRSLGELGSEWSGTYRIVDEETDEEVDSYPDDAPDITDAQIEQLRTEARQAGDTEQVEICDKALSTALTPLAASYVARARAECARVIADAAAQKEGGA